MNIVDLPLSLLVEASWNPNSMDAAMLGRLTKSIDSYGLVSPFVVRQMGEVYEILNGNQRRQVVERLGFRTVQCVVVEVDDAHARLLAQALNHLHGEDDLGLRADVLRTVLEHVPERDVLALLPESAESLRQLASIGQEDMADYLRASEKARAVRLKHLTVQLTPDQWPLVESVLSGFARHVQVGDEGNPNRMGLALYRLCQAHQRRQGAS